MMGRGEALKKIQTYRFAAYDMLLYLDTHPNDKKAFKLFKELVEKSKMLMAEFQKQYGPLTAFDTASQDSFNWLNSPWTWEKGANK